jgi:hypothetical protein
MRFLRDILSREESNSQAARGARHIQDHGFGKCAIEAPAVATLIGTVSLSWVSFEAPFSPAVGVACRLNNRYCGVGYVTEAAHVVIEDRFSLVRWKHCRPHRIGRYTADTRDWATWNDPHG